MKKLILISILLGFIATPAFANFTFDTADVLAFGKIDDYSKDTTSGDPSSFSGAYTDSASYGQTLPPGHVGLVAHAVGKNIAVSPGTMDYIGLGLTGVNLSIADTLVVTFSNDDNQAWMYKLFADIGDTGTQFVSGSWTTIAGFGASDTLSLAYSGLDATSRIGIMVGSDAQENTVHTSLLIPAPGAILLGGIGVCLVGWLRRRRTL